MADTDDSGVSLSNLDHSSLSDSTPLVFQCSNCNIIVGDSLSWVSADKIMRTVALSGVAAKVGVRTEISVASSGRDEGSTFNEVYCLECNENLGKKYIASSPEIDTLRGLYSLSAEKLNSYKLGGYEKNNNSLTDMVTCPNPVVVWRQVSKIKYLLVSINERLNTVEDKLSNDERREACREQKMKETTETDSRDTESVTSTENISSRFSCTSDSEVQVVSQGRKDADNDNMAVTRPASQEDRQRNRTPLSPRNISNQSRQVERDDTSEFNVPLPDRGARNTRRRPRLSSSRSGSCVPRQCNSKDSETEGEQETCSARMERWPHDEHVEAVKKRKRVTSP